MSTATLELPVSNSTSPAEMADAVQAALQRIPPLWPLRHFVAVNPFIGWIDRPFAGACEQLQRCVGAAPVQSPADYRRAFAAGEIDLTDLNLAGDEFFSANDLRRALDELGDEPASAPICTFADWLDRQQSHARWSTLVTEEISKWCAVKFDENQTTWTSPWKSTGLFAGWRQAAEHDLNPEAAGLVGFRKFVASLPLQAASAIEHCLHLLQPETTDPADFLHRQLATIAGWAGYIQYLVREDALRGRANGALVDLLAIRLAYDAALFSAFARNEAERRNWREFTASPVETDRFEILARWQNAFETGYQRRLATALAAEQTKEDASTRPPVQAVFCIDVRSEIFRRHLEEALPGAATIGFAGFFGFPVSHRSAGATTAASRCPVLLVPPVATADSLSSDETAAVFAKRSEASAWKAFQNSAASCFSFVEAAGLAFGAALGGARRSAAPSCSRPAPTFTSAELPVRAALAAGALKNMGLVRDFGRLVLLCGHGSQSANNPYASPLDCGACGGHAGDVNARLAARTLNDPAVRAELARQGRLIPADACFVAGLHNTTTDDVVLFDRDSVPDTHASELKRLEQSLAVAGAAARQERAAALGLDRAGAEQLAAALRGRATNIAQVRPEWGLANNAALIAAPRRRSRNLQLDGRVFLHDYDAVSDPDSQVLSLILSAPVVVASWINLQYYASRVQPGCYGSGNKALHNVVGGLGVMEGNGGDLKVGLPLQSIHDGQRFMHEPRRLAVYVEAPTGKIDAVLGKHPQVKQLFDHGWIHLWAILGDECRYYRRGSWVEM